MAPYEAHIVTRLRKTYNLRIERACFASGSIPQYILLDRTRNIHSYLIPCYIEGGIIQSSMWDVNSFQQTIMDVLRVQYSQLDRPLFLLYKDALNDIRIIEGGFIRDCILSDTRINIQECIFNESDSFVEVVGKIKQEL